MRSVKKILAAIIVVISCTSSATLLSAQTKQTYALIVGVAKYKQPDVKHLKYADDDAIAFKKLLMSKAGGSLKKENIKCFINDSATVTNIRSAIGWISNVPKSGDRVIFYFSGHGDAVNSENVFLLPYDANPADYFETGIDMDQLKRRIKLIMAKGVSAMVITDACRTNEVSTKNDFGITFEKVMEKNDGEMMLNSCLPDQKSQEDERWGHGHGVFTWFLIQGWMGMADVNENGKITAGELFTYVKTEVKKESYAFSEEKTRQVPTTCCDHHEDSVIAHVDAETLKRLKEFNNGVKDTSDVIAYATKKSGGDAYDEDTVTLRIYNNLIGAVADNNILTPANASAYHYYQELKKVADGKPIFYDAESELLSALNAKGQDVLNNYLNGSHADFNSATFKEAYEYMVKGLAIIPADDPYYSNFKTKALFLESQYLMYKVSSRNIALAKIDSAIALRPNGAYLFYSKGLIYEKFLNYDSAVVNYNKSIALVPKWHAPYVQKSNIYITTGRRSDAIYCMEEMIKKNPRGYNHLVLGDFYKDIDSSGLALIHYHRAISKDTSLIDAYIGLFSLYRKLQKDSLSNYYFDIAYALDPEYKKFNAMYAGYYEAIQDYGNAKKYYWELYDDDTTNLYYLVKVAEMQHKLNETADAIRLLESVIKADPFYTSTYYSLIDIYEQLGYWDQSIIYGKYLLTIDPGYNPANLYFAYFEMGNKDSAEFYLKLAEKKFPDNKLTTMWKAYDLMQNEKYKDAVFLFENMIKKGVISSWVYSSLAQCYNKLSNKDKCIKNAILAIKIDKYNVAYYKKLVGHLWDFDCSKDTIMRFVLEPINKHSVKTEEYLQFAAYQLTFLGYNDKLDIVCKMGISMYPINHKFYLYQAICYRKMGKKDFYDFFKKALDLGLRCEDIEEFKSTLPDPASDKKYQKMSKKLCPE